MVSILTGTLELISPKESIVNTEHREYPGNPERGGRPEDFNNLPTFLKTLRAALRRPGRDKGLSIAIPIGADSQSSAPV